ncbi:hypothetical protein [Streptomyces sp. NPDC021608]|uniref:hypothetical protein n=1 Tax=Streptomyces sp. NPDC021608 TaxID=3154903 RepID=UPI0033DD8D97
MNELTADRPWNVHGADPAPVRVHHFPHSHLLTRKLLRDDFNREAAQGIEADL